MAEEGAAPETEGGEAAPEQPEAAAAEEAPAAEPAAESEAPSEAPAEEGAAAGEPPAEGEPPPGGPAEEGGEAAGEEGVTFAEGEGGGAEEATEFGEETQPGGEEGAPGVEVATGEGEAEEARPPSEADELPGDEDMEQIEMDETSVAMKSSRIAVEEKPSVSMLEDQRKARLEKYGSRAKMALGSVIDIRYGSTVGDGGDRKVARFLNTYKLDSDNPFNPEKVNRILETVITEALENLTYDTDKCPKQAKWATSAIRAKVKELEFDRYKIVCIVTIGEKIGQDVLVTCRFLWDYDRDRYTTFSLGNTYVYATAQCFGLYYE